LAITVKFTMPFIPLSQSSSVNPANFLPAPPEEEDARPDNAYSNPGNSQPVRGFVPLDGFTANNNKTEQVQGFIPLPETNQDSASGMSSMQSAAIATEPYIMPVLKTAAAMVNPVAIGEAAANLGSQMIATPLAGLAGLGTAAANALGLTDRTGADTVQSVGDALTYHPHTELGKTASDLVSYPFQKLAEAGQWAGSHTLDATGSPIAAAAVDTAVNVLPAMFLDPAVRVAQRRTNSPVVDRHVDNAPLNEAVVSEIKTDPSVQAKEIIDAPDLDSAIRAAQDMMNAPIKQRINEALPDTLADAHLQESMSMMETAKPERAGFIPLDVPPEPTEIASLWNVERNEYGNHIITGNVDDIRALAPELRQAGISFIPKSSAEGTSSLMVSAKVDAPALMKVLDTVRLPEQIDATADTLNQVHNSYAPGANHVGLIDDIRSPVDSADTLTARDKPITREEVLSPLLKALDATMYQGRVKRANVLGYYRPKLEEIRIKRMGDIEVATHEIAHLLDDRIPAISEGWKKDKALQAELRTISYDSGKVNEGYAEGMRLFLTQPESLKAKAPLVFNWIESFTKNHEYGPALKKAQEGMTAWFAQDGINRARSKIGKPIDLNAAFDGFWDKFRQSTVDDLHGVMRMERDLTGKLSPVGPYESARLSRASQSIADGAIRNGYPVRKPDGSFTYKGRGLEQILKPVAANLDDALLYFVGKSAAELMKQQREHLFTRGEIDAMLRLRTPERDAAFNEYQKWNKGILDFAEAHGVINPDARALWQRTQYMPFHRVGTPDGFKGKPGDWSGIKALTGGTENLRDILGNMTANAAQLIDKAVKNESRQKIAALAREDGGGRFMVKIDAETRPVKLDKKAVLDGLLKTMGIDRAKNLPAHVQKMIKALEAELAKNPGMMEFFIGNQPPAGHNVVAVLYHGKPTWYEVADPILYRALSAIDRPNMPYIVKWLGLPKRIGQATITLTPDFMVANIARDTIMGAVMSRAGFVPVMDSLKGMKLRLTNDPLYKDYIANGGGLSSIYLDESKFRTKLEKFYSRQGINYRTVLDSPAKLLNFIEHMSDAFEMSTRLGEYQRAVAKGENPRHAAYLGREVSTDFAMTGDSQALSFLYNTVMFLRPAVLSLDRLYRGISQDPNKGAIAIKSGMVALMSIGLYLQNRDDPRYQALNDWDRDANWHFFVGNQHFRYPKIWEIGAMASVAERSVEKVIANDPIGLGKDFVRIVGNTFGMNYRPQIIAPLMEQAANRSNFTNAPIETPGMENVQPFLRAKPGTSETLKAAGMATRDLPESMQVNPVRAEALLRGYFNTWALYGLALTDRAFFNNKLPASRTDQLPVVRRFYSQEPPEHTKYETQFYDMLEEAKRLTGTLHELDKIGHSDIADQKEKSPMAGESQPLERAAKNLQGINQDMRMVQRSNDTPDEKRQKLNALTVERNALLKATVEDAQQAQETKK
jgi:hypothetical protein